jgi:hypothetical protein
VVGVGVDIPACLPVAVFKPMWFVHHIVGLHVVFGLVNELSVLTYFVSLVVKLLGLVSPLLILVCLVLTS